MMPKRTGRKKIYRKRNIPSSLKNAIWVTYNGKTFEAKCHVSWCKTIINVFNFEAGHDVPESKGGSTCIGNMRPICASCNRSMGNMYSIKEFSNTFCNQQNEQRPWWHRLMKCIMRPHRSVKVQPQKHSVARS